MIALLFLLPLVAVSAPPFERAGLQASSGAASLAAAPADAARVATFVVARRADGVVGSAAALMQGRLAVVGNCVLVRSESGVETVPVFGAGSAVWDARAGRLRYRGRLYSVGDVVPIGGGGVNPARIPEMLRNPLIDVPGDCPTARLWFSPG